MKRIGLSSGIIDFVQEIGRYGRVIKENETNLFSLIFTLNDYVYLIERSHIVKSEDTNSTDENSIRHLHNHVLNADEERKMGVDNVNGLCQLLFLNFGCWHSYLECYLSNMSPNLYLYHYNLCGNFCPSCNGIQESMIKRVSRVGLQNFLAIKIIQNAHQRYTLTQLATHLN